MTYHCIFNELLYTHLHDFMLSFLSTCIYIFFYTLFNTFLGLFYDFSITNFVYIVLLYIVQDNIVKQRFRLYVLPCLNIFNK